MYFIDTHAHISLFNDASVARLIEDGKTRDLQFWMMAGYDAPDWQRQLTLIEKYPKHLAPCFGLHPWRVIEMTREEIAKEMLVLQSLLPRAQALGETGIDKFKTEDIAIVQKQEDIFREHLEINKSLKLPLVLHIVRAENEALAVLKEYSYAGVIHGFSASYETAKRYVALGYKIGVGRGVYSKGYKHLKETAEKLSLNDILIESDSGPSAEGENEDAVDVFFKTVAAVAVLKKVSSEEVLRQNFLNAKQVFRL